MSHLTDAQNDLIAANVQLALKFASSILGIFVSPDSEAGASAYYGLVVASQKYDKSRGKFDPCLYEYVRRQIGSDRRGAHATLTSKCRICKGKTGNESYDYVNNQLLKSSCIACGSTGLRNGGSSGLDQLSAPTIKTEDSAQTVETLLAKLDPKSAEILRRRYLDKQTQIQVAIELDISRTYVHVLEHRALKALARVAVA